VSQKPSIARIVIVTVDPRTNNGSDTAPAVITRVNSEQSVNLRILLDASTSVPAATSVELCEDESLARAAVARHREQFVAAGGTPGALHPTVAYWPPRV
jgi:hypothetical protein